MTLSPTKRAALRQRWLAEIDAEIERRQAAALEAAGGDPREQLLDVLEQMGQRMRAARDWIEPSADEKVQLSRQVDKWFAENGYYDHLACAATLGVPPSPVQSPATGGASAAGIIAALSTLGRVLFRSFRAAV